MDIPKVRWPSSAAEPHQWSAFALHTDPYMLRIHGKSHRLCSKEFDKEALIAIDLKDSENVSVEDVLQKPDPVTGFCRILSICAENSVSPFGVTEEILVRMLQRYNIPVAFLNIILAFGQKPSSGVAGMSQAAFSQRNKTDFELQYLLTYVELAEGAKENDLRYWTTRQTGLYQKYTRHNDSGLSVLLQPMKQSTVQKTLNRLKADHENQPRSCIVSLIDIHLIVLSTYFRNWQRYLTVLNDEFEDIAAILFTIKWNDSRDYEDGQERLPWLHALLDRVLVISPRLRATLDILETLEVLQLVDMHTETESRSEDADYRRRFLHELRTYKELTAGLLESARLLERRMEATLKMLSATLNLRHQATGADTSGGPLKSTTETVSNRSTLQVIAFVTLLSMPATFVATVLGTKLSTHSASASDLGFGVPLIFSILAIAVTLITIGCGLFYSQGTKNLRLKGAGDQKSAKGGK